jgi:hypothetical protein
VNATLVTPLLAATTIPGALLAAPNALAFLGGAVVLSVLGSIVFAVLHRKDRRPTDSIDQFNEQLRALAPRTRNPRQTAGRDEPSQDQTDGT